MRSKFCVLVKEIDDDMCVEYKYIDAVELDLKHAIVKEFNNIKADIILRTATIGIMAEFSVNFTAAYACVRCLDTFTRTSQARLLLNFVDGNDSNKENENIDLKQTDINKTYFHGPCIDLKMGIREAILLSIPIAPLCGETCAGLCTVCGVNKNKTTCTCVEDTPGLFTPIDEAGSSRKSVKQKTDRKK